MRITAPSHGTKFDIHMKGRKWAKEGAEVPFGRGVTVPAGRVHVVVYLRLFVLVCSGELLFSRTNGDCVARFLLAVWAGCLGCPGIVIYCARVCSLVLFGVTCGGLWGGRFFSSTPRGVPNPRLLTRVWLPIEAKRNLSFFQTVINGRK